MNDIHNEELYNKDFLNSNNERELYKREQQIENDLEEYMHYLKMNRLGLPYA